MIVALLLTESSDSNGEQWHMISFTDIQTGKATPFRMTFPALFLFLNIAEVFCTKNCLVMFIIKIYFFLDLFNEFVSKSADIDYLCTWYTLIFNDNFTELLKYLNEIYKYDYYLPLI